MLKTLADWLSERVLRYLERPTGRYAPFFAPELDVLRKTLQVGDVILVEGNTRLSAIIKYLTQSSWSHAALYIGKSANAESEGGDPDVLLEADPKRGIVAVPLSKYAVFNTRICRPSGLSEDDRQKVVAYGLRRIGMQYDRKQIIDLARYLFPYPPVPVTLRRRLLSIGSGDPTRAICSSLIGEAFMSVRYPILPESEVAGAKPYNVAPYVEGENDHIRRRGLFTPRDFDVSPYFDIIKPKVRNDFDDHRLEWPPDTGS